MINLNVGNLWTDDFLDSVIELNNLHKEDNIRITSLFGSGAWITPTARSFDRIPRLSYDMLKTYTEKAISHGIAIRWTLNMSCVGSIQDFYASWRSKLNTTVQELHDLGIREWTITSPLVFELMRKEFPDDYLEVSTIAEVSSPSELQRWLDLGADGVNLSTSINRKRDVLVRMRDMNKNITLLANEACLYRCPWRRECYNMSSHDSTRSGELFNHYPFSRCNEKRIDQPEEWIKSRMILPQWMEKYRQTTGVNHFKVAFRTHPIETALPILISYMNKYHGGNYLSLWPTIAHLAKSGEPINMIYISSKRLDDISFLEKSMTKRCETSSCTGCTFCLNMYNVCKE